MSENISSGVEKGNDSGLQALNKLGAQGLFEVIHDAIVVVSGQQRIVAFNRAAEKVFQYSAAEVLGRELGILIPRRSLSTHPKDVEGFRRSNEGSRAMTSRRTVHGLRKDGSVFPADVTIAKMGSGESEFMVAVVRDSTERADAEALLRLSEERYRELAKSVPVGIWRCDHEGRCEYVNPAGRLILGLSADEVLGTSWARNLHPDDKEMVHGHWNAMVEEGRKFRLEYRFTGADNVTRWVLGRAEPTVGEDGEKGFTGTITDITRLKTMQDRLTEAEEELRLFARELTQAREKESSRISREIHDDLGQSLTALKIDLTRYLVTTGAGVRGAGKIEGMVGLVDEMIDNVRRICTELRPSILDHLGLAAAIEWLCKKFNEKHEIRCELVVSGMTLPDDDQFVTTVFRVIQEALTNVVRHANASRVQVGIDATQTEVQVTVSDDGIGIDADKPQKGAISLGMVGIRERIVALEGTVRWEPRKNRGTSLFAVIPIDPNPGSEV